MFGKKDKTAMEFNVYQGSSEYIASRDLCDVVNVAIALERPLLIRGEPGTGKTLLAHSISKAIGLELITWHIKSTTKARDGLYQYDTVRRLHDSRFGDRDVSDIRQYITLGPLGRAFTSESKAVLLIDEVDKADIEFPNDLLNELDNMCFYIPEIDETVSARQRPIVIITSNAEKELPDAFLRRCVFHYIDFPDEKLMSDIIMVHYPDLQTKLLKQCLVRFYWLREQDELKKKPSTSELLDWIGALIRGGMDPGKVEDQFPFLGSLIKKETDMNTIKQAISGNRRLGSRLRI